VSDFILEVHKWPFLHMYSENMVTSCHNYMLPSFQDMAPLAVL